ncbi:non-homologous end-joining DNA ligase [Ornithinicoccus hortensis]|uniref:Bifunctional non-homologous end joining protein LigD n=1 Tax=Ornithinicoccus hortensis TaxID=82346 RepID=A0A542YVW0_9MICO|nr:non-homologous end-joining DNA ligase [Ornithinicoccus hortensis]TQL52228.1 bifunctional non-homologous end joining protein LigD [Ornithinicoccus hortensis]
MASGPVQSVSVGGRTLRVSSLDKVLFPATGTTKGEVLQYYVQAADRLLPRLAGRPVTRIRWPHGVSGQSFFEKNLPSGAPDWLRSVTIRGHGSRSGRESVTYPLVEDLPTLVYLVNLGSLELHVPQWRVDGDGHPLPPDRMVVDLDPGPGAGLTECARVAVLVRDQLAAVGLDTQPVTSGSKGMQLYAELDGDRTSEEVSEVARTLAQLLAERHPDLVVWKMTKALRPGKVFLDWSQNNAAKTTICPYSLRGRERPQVAAPREWAEVEAAADGSGSLVQVTYDEVLGR